MEDFYLHQNHSRKGCLSLAVLIVLVAAVLFGVVMIFKGCARKRAEREFEQSLGPETTDQAVAEEVVAQPVRVEPTPSNASQARPTPRPRPANSGPDQGTARLPEAEKLFAEEDYASLREVGFAILETSNDEAARARVEELLGKAHIQMVFSPYPMEEKVEHTVARGDTLAVLAKKHGTTVELIQKGNNIRGSLIRQGDRYRIFNGKFSIVVDKSDNDLVLLLNGRFFKRYRVGTGQYAKTPVGDFMITDRVAQPIWWRPDGKRVPFGDPENLLGTHWLSLNIRGYGLHGTWEPESIGKQASAGCVRLLNEDIEELFTLLPVGTPVTIQE